MRAAECRPAKGRPERRWEGPPWPTCDKRQLRPSASRGAVQAEALRPLACPAVEQEVLLGPSQQVLEVALLPEREAIGHLSYCSKARGVGASTVLHPAASTRHCLEPCPASTAQPRQSCVSGSSRGREARCWLEASVSAH